MEDYREKLKIQNITFGVCGLVLGLFSVCAMLGEAEILPFFAPLAGSSRWQSLWRGFVSGVSFALLAFMLFGLARNVRALRSEKELKKLYVKEHDERTIQIWTSSRAAAFQTILIFGLVAVVISGYFSMTVSLTILACIWFASLTGFAFKFYYSKKF